MDVLGVVEPVSEQQLQPSVINPVAQKMATGTRGPTSVLEDGAHQLLSQEFSAEERAREFVDLPEVGYTSDLEAMQRQFAEEWSLRARSPLRSAAPVAGAEQGPSLSAVSEACPPTGPTEASRPRDIMDGRNMSAAKAGMMTPTSNVARDLRARVGLE